MQGNDYHPPCFVGPAEEHLSVLFDALRTSRQWPHMLFLITFDEHGGSYDHVPPPHTVAPDDHVGTRDDAPVRVHAARGAGADDPGDAVRHPGHGLSRARRRGPRL